MNRMYKLEIETRISELIRVFKFLSDICIENKFSSDVEFDLNLIFEEFLLNLINYGYKGIDSEKICIEIEVYQDLIKIRITDTAVSFDIRETGDFDSSLPLDKRRVGGIGIHLIKSAVDKIDYESISGKNITTFHRTLNI